MTYFNANQKLDMIKAIVESYEEFEEICSKVEKIKEILKLNETIESRDKLETTKK